MIKMKKSMLFLILFTTLFCSFASADYFDDYEVYYNGTLKPNNDVPDWSGNGENGTNNGMLNDTKGGYTAFVPTGLDDYINANTLSNNVETGDNQGHFSFWVWKANNQADHAGYESIIGASDGGAAGTYFGIDAATNKWILNSVNRGVKIYSDNQISSGWTKIDIMYNSGDSKVYMYINGTRQADDEGVNNWFSRAGVIDTLYICKDPDTNDNECNASIGSLLFFPTPRNETWINQTRDNKNPNFNNQSSPLPSNFTITAMDYYTNDSLTNFTAIINGTDYNANINATAGTVTTGILSNSTYVYNITIQAIDYFNRTYENINVSTNFQAVIWQHILYVSVLDITSNESISNFTINTVKKTVTSSPLYFNVTNETINITSPGYQQNNYSVVATAQTEANTTIYLYPYLTFNILKETTNDKFNVNETQSSKLSIICPEKTNEYTFNKTTNNNTLNIIVDCVWELIKLDITYADSSYFRTLIPEHTERNITFYALDLSEDQTVQVIITLNDLTGEYDQGTAYMTKSIGGISQDIIEQIFDVENKVTLYLLKDGLYTLTIETADSTTQRNLGYFYASSAGEKTVTIPDINYVPSNKIGNTVSWEWQNNLTLSKLIYNDSDLETTLLNFTVYNASNLSIVMYTTTSSNLGLATFSYNIPVNTSYMACMNVTHSTLNNFGSCKIIYHKKPVGSFDGWTAEQEAKLKNWFSAILIVFFTILIGQLVNGAAGLFLGFLLTWLFHAWEWLNFGNPILNTLMIMFAALYAVLAFIEVVRQ